MDQCRNLLCDLQSEKGRKNARRGWNVPDPKTEGSHLDPALVHEPGSQGNPRTLAGLSLSQFRIGLVIDQRGGGIPTESQWNTPADFREERKGR